MSVKYESIVPWGRSFQEYVNMFNLTFDDLDKSILSCGDGPASFNSTMKKSGKTVVSIDPLYNLNRRTIEKKIEETYETVMGQTKYNEDKFVWSTVKDVEELGNIRMTSMREFLSDYETGKIENRYITAELPYLPFENNQFELALSSHFLFLYTENLSLDFHMNSIDEMLRVSEEVRIFPLLDMNAVPSIHLPYVVESLTKKGCKVEKIGVNYEFQKGGNSMLKITK
ncbi:SAM-dependent methyltransferase [Methanobacterium congolense]|uniref:SAM-dependent methyltransferase n=1 Tax=Methanobacterium congolense TaxID=118062 RepID=A0A1D3L447_9EURY|nr:SAM-dependent methyltransferase [Methanobacterium congolense]SCG86346.1 putative protein MJ0045 [Methanobacterium congolense]